MRNIGKRNSAIIAVLAIALIALAVFTFAAILPRLDKVDKTRDLSVGDYTIAQLDEKGKKVESEFGLVSNEIAIEKFDSVTWDEKADVKGYYVYTYNYKHELVKASALQKADLNTLSTDLTTNAKYFRIYIETTEEVKLLDMGSVIKQVTVTIAR